MNEHGSFGVPPSTMRLRLRKLQSRSSGEGWTPSGWRGQPIVRVWLRTKQARRTRDVHLGQAVVDRNGLLQGPALARLLYRCRSRLVAMGFDDLRREELVDGLRASLRERRLLVDGEP
jgi:hypothetical protein